MKRMLPRITALCLLAAIMAGISAPLLAADPTPPTPKTPATAVPEATGPAKFYGPITAIDAKAGTFTVGDQTFSVVAETQIVDKEDKKATLADAVVGEPARGTYTKRSDGKLDVTKVRFGKKAGGKGGGKKKKAADTTAPDAKSGDAK